MQSRKITCLWAAIVLTVAPLGFGVSIPETAKLLPQDTVFLIEINDVTELQAQFGKTAFGRLYKDPSMARFIEHCKTGFQQTLEQDQQVKNLADKLVLPTGRMALAVIVPQGRKEGLDDPRLLFLAQWGANLEAGKKFVESIIESGMEDRDSVSTEIYRDVPIITITWPEETPDMSGQTVEISPGQEQEPSIPTKTVMKKLSRCFIEDVFLVSNDPEPIKFVIAHMPGTSGDTLSQREAYLSAMQTTGPWNDVRLYIGLDSLLSWVASSDAGGQAKAMLTSLGLDNLSYAAVSAGVARKPVASVSGKAALRTKGPRRGLMKVFEMKTRPFTVPGFLGAEACSVAVVHWDINTAFDEIFRMLSSMQPMFAAILVSPLTPVQQDGSGGVQLKRDIISHLGSQIVIAESLNKTSKELGAADILVCAETTDRARLEAALGALHSQYIAAGKPDTQRDFLGHKIYTIELPQGLFGVPGAGQPMGPAEIDDNQVTVGLTASGKKLAFSVTDSYLLFGEQTQVENALRAMQDRDFKSITSAQWYRRAQNRMPGAGAFASMANDAVVWEQLWEMFRSGKYKESTFGLVLDMQGEQAEAIHRIFDFALLPSFQTVRHYFGISIRHGQCREDGLDFEFESIDPADR
ncbi:MAG: hypothetical protein JW828_14810 [Sedimentisphaerales bacterium]|nr:hypothetical protein [Sedimentisphaerales bacterium]